VTDGERRYGNLLFKICHELLRNGPPRRPPKVLLKGIKVRLKNKGDSAREPEHPRPKYEAQHREHPETRQDIAEMENTVPIREPIGHRGQ
jgi:hypothetical protein